uniref:DNA polymerase II subunit 2 n=1 Tax=Arcella intermedia TaxID=1963864 RepID=A0A6B2LH60_9EUKA
MDQLKVLFMGIKDVAPSVFVFMGNFSSRPYGEQWADKKNLKMLFKNLADLIGEYPEICNTSKFIFIPGGHDAGLSILPKPPLPDFLVQPLKSKLKHVTFGTNPFRIRCGRKKILLFREDLATKLRRNVILQPSDTSSSEPIELHDHVGLTIASTGHLCPLPERKKPIYWNFDNALSLYPLPDCVVLADKYQPFDMEIEGCLFLNPGPFYQEYTFVNYEPFHNKVTHSMVPA